MVEVESIEASYNDKFKLIDQTLEKLWFYLMNRGFETCSLIIEQSMFYNNYFFVVLLTLILRF